MTKNDALAPHLLSLLIATAENNVPAMTGILNNERDLFREAVTKNGHSMDDFYALLHKKATEHRAHDAAAFLNNLRASEKAQAERTAPATGQIATLKRKNPGPA